MGLDPVTGKGLDDAVIVIDHHIETEAGPGHGCGLEDVGVENVGVRHVALRTSALVPLPKPGFRACL